MNEPTIAIVGAGKMATALASGWVRAGVTKPQSIVATDRTQAARDAFEAAVPGARTTDDNPAAAQQANIVLLAVKPHQIVDVMRQLRPVLGGEQLVISIAAGVRLEKLAAGAAPKELRLARVMPNTPSLIGRGACGFSLGPHATPQDAELVARLMGAVGVAHQAPENLLEAVTAVSGSGPAFVYTVIEAMTDAGVRAGLTRAVAADLAAHTVAGAAEMVLQTGRHTAQLRDEVTSPGGATAAGLAALEQHGLRAALLAAAAATEKKSKELG